MSENMIRLIESKVKEMEADNINLRASAKALARSIGDCECLRIEIERAHISLIDMYHEKVHPELAKHWQDCPDMVCRRTQHLLFKPSPTEGQ